jgi:hypothetical protein
MAGKDNCKHAAYVLKDGALVCAACDAPSPSALWRANVYGANSPQAKAPQGAAAKA